MKNGGIPRHADATYDADFFSDIGASAIDSARVVVPWIVELIGPKSVVDIGCGRGEWLAEFSRNGIEDICGIDGPWIKKLPVEVPANRITVSDLSDPRSVEVARSYDLALCLEVAEHLPDATADQLITLLTQLAPCVLFSAAIPDQGGVGHVNEQWPSYWVQLFDQHDYECFDCIRGKFWDVEAIAPWYIQNALFFVRRGELEKYREISRAEREYSLKRKSLVHPRQYRRRIHQLQDPLGYSIKKIVRVLPRLLAKAVRRRFVRSSDSVER